MKGEFAFAKTNGRRVCLLSSAGEASSRDLPGSHVAVNTHFRSPDGGMEGVQEMKIRRPECVRLIVGGRGKSLSEALDKA